MKVRGAILFFFCLIVSSISLANTLSADFTK